MGNLRNYTIGVISIQNDQQSVLFDKIKDAFTKKEVVISDCDNCKVRDLYPLPDQMAWFCFKSSIKQENCTGYEPK